MGEAVKFPLETQQLQASLLVIEGSLLQSCADTEAHFVGLADHIVASHLNLAGSRGQQGNQHSDDGRLARTVGAEETVNLPTVYS